MPLTLLGGSRRSPRPAPVNQGPLPPFDPSDPGGIVYTTPPPEFQPARAKYFLQADFNGVTLSGGWQWNGTPAAHGSSVTMTSGPWTGLVVPFLVGANSTPPTMLMTPMLPLYPRAVQDAALTEHAWRAYPDFVVSDVPWNAAENGRGHWGPAETVAWAQYVQSWGFRVPLWSIMPINGDPTFRAMLNASCVSFYVPGEEIAGKMTAEQLPPLLDTALADCGRGLPIAVHLAPLGPLRFPADTFLDGGPNRGSWGQYDGVVGLAYESGNLSNSPTLSDPAGEMGALLGYARSMVQLGKSGDGSWGVPGPNCPIYAWELLATSQLNGVNNGGVSVPDQPVFNEAYGCLRSLEMLYTPAVPGESMINGYANGGRLPPGTPVYNIF